MLHQIAIAIVCRSRRLSFFFFFFFNDTATTEIYTLSLHDALPILCERDRDVVNQVVALALEPWILRDVEHGDQVAGRTIAGDRKSTRLNSSHSQISYAVFCLKKKKKVPVHLTARMHRYRSLSLPRL